MFMAAAGTHGRAKALLPFGQGLLTRKAGEGYLSIK